MLPHCAKMHVARNKKPTAGLQPAAAPLCRAGTACSPQCPALLAPIANCPSHRQGPTLQAAAVPTAKTIWFEDILLNLWVQVLLGLAATVCGVSLVGAQLALWPVIEQLDRIDETLTKLLNTLESQRGDLAKLAGAHL